jgi:flagellar biosynthetic protein FliS
MNAKSAADAYREGSIENAPPLKIVRMLAVGSQRFLERALTCDPSDPGSEFIHWLSRADAILVELRLALDSQASEEVSGLLEQLYLFAEDRIQTAMSTRDAEPAREALRVVSQLARTWNEVELPQVAGEHGA